MITCELVIDKHFSWVCAQGISVSFSCAWWHGSEAFWPWYI